MKTKLLENHICAFNDGEQSCECYKKACEDTIKLIEALVAPDCIDDSCEYIHEGYFKAVEDIINKIKEM